MALNRSDKSRILRRYFPGMTRNSEMSTEPSLLAGIVNAPWKTNEDRQNLLPGVYNDELVDAAAVMVANALPRLSTRDDPAKHLDALPRREEAGDSEHSNRLRDQLYSSLRDRHVVPDQKGSLRKLTEISYPPRELTVGGQVASAALQQWKEYSGRPTNWLHHSALTTNRLARLERLHRPHGSLISTPLPRSSIAHWLETLGSVDISLLRVIPGK